MTDATPTPMPPMTRNKPNISTLIARPVPKALTRNSSAAIFITASLPILSASRPATNAPRAAPISAAATATPVTSLLIWKWSSTAATAPLMTALSYPKSNPPRAATEAIRTTRPLCSDSS